MKIKTVCELTGLSDRTIRYYIEEELLSPDFVENYLGRRTFDFGESDVKCLKDISVLRKFGFSITDIKAIKECPEKSKEILSRIRCEKRKLVDEQAKYLSVIENIEHDRDYTIAELAELLVLPVSESELPIEDTKKSCFKIIKGFVKKLVIGYIGIVPITFMLAAIVSDYRMYEYPKLNDNWWLFILLALLPSLVILILFSVKRRRPVKKLVRRIALVCCLLYLPVSFLFSWGVHDGSMTTYYADYRKLDAECIENKSLFFQELFPVSPRYFENVKNEEGQYETVFLDATYYYHFYYGFDYTYDIIAEWPLEKEEFEKEVERARKLFKEYEAKEENGVYDYTEVKKGSYTCLVRCDQNENDRIFEKVTDSYVYYIFAYDEAEMRVRYIVCASMDNGDDQPYYLELEW